MSLLDHALAVAGFSLKPTGMFKRAWLLRHGAPITLVSWDGCMATVRNERGRGVVLRRCNNRDIFGPQAADIRGILVRTRGGERFVPLDWLRVVDGRLEAWV